VSSSVYEMAGVVQYQILMQAPAFITVSARCRQHARVELQYQRFCKGLYANLPGDFLVCDSASSQLLAWLPVLCEYTKTHMQG